MSLGRTTDTMETLFRTLETKLLHLELWCVTFSQQSGNTIRTKIPGKGFFDCTYRKKCKTELGISQTLLSKTELFMNIKMFNPPLICFCCTIFPFSKPSVSYHKWRHMLKWSLKYISCFSTIFHSVYNKLLMYLACIIFLRMK